MQQGTRQGQRGESSDPLRRLGDLSCSARLSSAGKAPGGRVSRKAAPLHRPCGNLPQRNRAGSPAPGSPRPPTWPAASRSPSLPPHRLPWGDPACRNAGNRPQSCTQRDARFAFSLPFDGARFSILALRVCGHRHRSTGKARVRAHPAASEPWDGAGYPGSDLCSRLVRDTLTLLLRQGVREGASGAHTGDEYVKNQGNSSCC